MSQYQQPQEVPRKKYTAKEIFRNPAVIILLALFAIFLWFGVSFVTNPGPSLNYNGTAEVVKISQTPTKCFAHIKREDGRETKQSMAKDSCRQFRVGDIIKIENGQYVSTVRSDY